MNERGNNVGLSVSIGIRAVVAYGWVTTDGVCLRKPLAGENGTLFDTPEFRNVAMAARNYLLENTAENLVNNRGFE